MALLKSTAVGATALAGMGSVLASAAGGEGHPNVLFLMTDQQRFDAIRFVQESLPRYSDKARIQTPNLDRLLKDGAYFSTAYSQCAVCAPVRAVLRTGCTVERCGVQSNGLATHHIYRRMEQFRRKIDAGESLEQILVEEYGYQAAYYGKWHMPDRFWFKRAYTRKDDGPVRGRDSIFTATDTPEDRVIRFNDVNWKTGELCYTYDPSYQRKFKRGLQAYFAKYGKGLTDRCSTEGRPGFGPQYISSFSGYPYDSVAIDSLNTKGLPAGAQRPQEFRSQPNLVGRDCLDEHLTPTYFTAEGARLAIRRFAGEKKPFIITASFHNPHAPMIATGKFFDRYWDQRKRLFVPPSHKDPMEHSDYAGGNGRTKLLRAGLRYSDPGAIREWTVAYYALCEEIDFHVGRLLDELKDQGVEDNTMVVFLSDHGEMLGAHGMREKNIFLEESARVPLFVRFPGRIPPGSRVDTPVSLLDVFATILDYCGASAHDKGDGESLRRHIENTSFNEHYDDEAIVTEWDFRRPMADGKTLERTFGGVPNFLCRKGPWKLMMTKKAGSPLKDMLYNLDHDPYEISNVIYSHRKADWLSKDEMIGKAEHLKALLIEWMARMDGKGRFYSDPKYNAGEGHGDIAEIRRRRTWDKADFWVSDRVISVGRLARVEGRYRKNIWLYFGTTTDGELTISSIACKGSSPEAALKGFTEGAIASGDHQKVALCIDSRDDQADGVEIEIKYSKNGRPARAVITLVP